MIKVHGSYDRLEIIFWDLLFWAMKALQGLRNSWTKISDRILPTLKSHLYILLVVCTFGLALGFCLGYGNAFVGR